MKKAKDLLKENLIIADGAMGTWYVNKYQKPLSDCEMSNLDNPDDILEIHKDYIAAGARLLRSNTFAIISPDSADSIEKIAEIAAAGYKIALKAAGETAWAAADFGPVYDVEQEICEKAWQAAAKAFVKEGADLFVLETFADPEELLPLCKIIRQENPEAIILASFAISADGYTRKGLSLDKLDQRISQMQEIDILGLNCGVGPTHLRQLICRLPLSGKPLSLMPNSGYPRMENQRMVFGSTPKYFADSSQDLYHPRLLILGGCCGTTPEHIKELNNLISKGGLNKNLNQPCSDISTGFTSNEYDKNKKKVFVKKTGFTSLHLQEKIKNKEFITVCELDPPKNSDLGKMINSAAELSDCGIDAITIADSPLSRVKLDPIIAAARIYRETGLPVLPHITCRDRNVNALRSLMLGAHSEGIRQILAITGDRIPESDRGFVKPVFNVNSSGLLSLAKQMNQDVFAESPFLLAAAADLGAANPEIELKRIAAKKETGASMILTQPVYIWDQSIQDMVSEIRAMNITVLLGLMPLVSLRNASYMDQEVPGIRIPKYMIEQFKPDMAKKEAEKIGLEQILSISEAAKDHVDGFYLIAPFNRSGIIKEFMLKSGLNNRS